MLIDLSNRNHFQSVNIFEGTRADSSASVCHRQLPSYLLTSVTDGAWL